MTNCINVEAMFSSLTIGIWDSYGSKKSRIQNKRPNSLQWVVLESLESARSTWVLFLPIKQQGQMPWKTEIVMWDM